MCVASANAMVASLIDGLAAEGGPMDSFFEQLAVLRPHMASFRTSWDNWSAEYEPEEEPASSPWAFLS